MTGMLPMFQYAHQYDTDIDIDMDILYCSAHWPTRILHYRQQSSQLCQCRLFLNFRFGLVEM